jgi:mono-ADP-ribosyltransferase sirtuin 6
MPSTDQEVVMDAETAVPDYASRLSDYSNKGVCGLPETVESSRSLKVKLNKLHEHMIKSKHIVFFTGAGISTA